MRTKKTGTATRTTDEGAQRRAAAGSSLPFALALALAGAPAAHAQRSPDQHAHPQIGTASWYGARHQGRPTATGEIFDMARLTAAHRTLPLGTHARITNLENGRTVEVVINDRGPALPGRIVDVSAQAASVLGMRARGLARVAIERLPD
jgi:rare lipoprotein A